MRVLPKVVVWAILIGACLPALASNSADLPHVHVQLMTGESGVLAPGLVDAGLYFKLESGWHVYWKNPGDAGQPPKIVWTLPNGVSAAPFKFPAPKRLPLGPLMDFGYEGEVLFPLLVNVNSSFKPGSTAHLSAKVNWLVCRETCIPEKTNLDLDIPVVGTPPAGNAATPLFQRYMALLPKPMPAGSQLGFVATADGFRLTAVTGQRETQAQFFPADQDLIANAAPQTLTPTAKGLTLVLKKDANAPNTTPKPTELRGLLELSDGRTYEIAAPSGPPVAVKPLPEEGAPAPAFSSKQPNSAGTAQPEASGSGGAPVIGGTSLVRTIFLAFLGGIILNLMPCVFPVLFLKGLALVNSGSEERHKLRAHGLVYTAGIVVSFWVLVALLLSLRAAGARLGWGFQFQSPIFLSLMAGLLFFLGLSLAGQFEIGLSLTSAGGSLAAKQGYTGSFFTGVLAVIVATPCTAPFMGAAIGYAIAAPAFVTFAVFTALALGLAAPYLALTLQPAWTSILPRPGAWMEVLRQAVSVPIFGTVIWLAWVVASAYGATMLAVLLIGFLLLAVAGWFLGRWPATRWSAILAGLIVLCVIGLSVYSARALAEAPRATTAATTKGSWEPWSDATVARYQSAGRPVFVDFTASWCLSCQVNERIALNQPDVRNALAAANVALLRADWTNYDENIQQALEKLGRSGVPTYVLYTPGQGNPKVLPEALTPGIVLDALSKLPPAATQTGLASSNLK